MKKLLRLLNSRKFAVYLLFIMIVLLVLSTFLPNEITVTEDKWRFIAREKPTVYWLSTHFSTPYLVQSIPFIVLSIFLFLSTLTCTLQRVQRWVRTRMSEFEKEKAFSFTVEENLSEPVDIIKDRLFAALKRKRWIYTTSETDTNDTVVIEGQKGSDLGFWGSVIFHAGLIICFLAVPVTAMTVFRGQFLATEGMMLPIKEGLIYDMGRPVSSLPDFDITIKDLKGQYAKGVFKVDFSGVLNINGQDYPVWINNPIKVEGYQFNLHEFGNAIKVRIEKDDRVLFDYFLNLRHSKEGDYFPFESEDLVIFALFFPDFFRDGTMLGTRTKEPRNPVLLIRFIKGEERVAQGLLPLGEVGEVGGYKVIFEELRNWANFVVVREWGVPVIAVGMVIGLCGLLLRFLSNERRLEVNLAGLARGTVLTLKGYSRYYPAFLEQEVIRIADSVGQEGTA